MMQDMVLLVIAFLLAGIVQGLFGFGFVMASTLILVTKMDITPLVFINLAMSVLTSLLAMLSIKNLKAIPIKLLAKLMISSVAGVFLGLYLMDYIDASLLKQITLVVILIAAILSLTQSKSLFSHPSLSWIGGFISGVLTPSTGINGPPVMLHLNAALKDKAQTRVTMLAYLLVVMTFGLISLAIKPGFDEPNLQTLALVTPPSLIGYGIGLLTFKKLRDLTFQKLVTGFLICSSIAALINLFFTK